jgi:predicted ATPase
MAATASTTARGSALRLQSGFAPGAEATRRPAADPALVEQAIGASVGADGDLIAYVASKRLLVVLDNFEQVVKAAPVVSALLAGTPNAKVLITSREPLHLDSERRYSVEPLPEHDAAMLFVERASAIAPGFRPTAAVGEICRRLDGLPLAIELAAARVALLEPDELPARLGRRLPLLTSRSRNAPRGNERPYWVMRLIKVTSITWWMRCCQSLGLPRRTRATLAEAGAGKLVVSIAPTS